MDARRRFIRRVEGVHAALGACAVAVAIALWSQAIWSGVLMGALLGGLNFRALALLAAKFTETGENAARSGAMGLIIVKMAVMMAAVGGVMVFAEPNVGAFLVGISGAPVAMMLVAVVARPTFDDSPQSAAGAVQVTEVQR
jgi:hypothetical protein